MSDVVYRIDRFVVPAPARDAFLERVRQTHAVLRDCPGFVRDTLVEQPLAEGRSAILTLVEWTGQPAIEAARDRVGAAQRADGFRPAEFMAGLGVQAEFGVYRDLRP
ncbi:antibiotic biosynthesis monooxygenase family protein [Pseudooceanicola sp. LIPI14-2-Ac024]|uniref:antibiotic biosynthesis monooxygenase family protein n=1 Tax=Pseudooceanicola sp. LIPI14-2-Ac024 TaxID=3344875 RepID=UPI0035D0EC21